MLMYDDHEEEFDDAYDDEFDDDYDDSDDAETVPCPECGTEIYEESVACPVCGAYVTYSSHSLTNWPRVFVWLGLIGSAAVIWALIRVF